MLHCLGFKDLETLNFVSTHHLFKFCPVYSLCFKEVFFDLFIVSKLFSSLLNMIIHHIQLGFQDLEALNFFWSIHLLWLCLKFFYCVHCLSSLRHHHVIIMLSSQHFEFLFDPHATIGLLSIVLFVHPFVHCVAITLLQGLRF